MARLRREDIPVVAAMLGGTAGVVLVIRLMWPGLSTRELIVLARLAVLPVGAVVVLVPVCVCREFIIGGSGGDTGWGFATGVGMTLRRTSLGNGVRSAGR